MSEMCGTLDRLAEAEAEILLKSVLFNVLWDDVRAVDLSRLKSIF